MTIEKASVLLVDDEDATRLKVACRLKEAGYEVFEASNGLEGLQGFYHNRPTLVVLDVAMPEMDGWKVLQRIREVSNVPVLMLTAVKQEHEKIRGLNEGAEFAPSGFHPRLDLGPKVLFRLEQDDTDDLVPSRVTNLVRHSAPP